MSYETFFETNQIRSKVDGAIKAPVDYQDTSQVFNIHWDDCVGYSIHKKIQDEMSRYNSEVSSIIARLKNEANSISDDISSDLSFINGIMGK